MVALTLVKNMGPVSFRRLFEAFGSLEGIFRSNFRTFERAKGPAKIDWKEIQAEAHLKEAEAEIDKASCAGVSVITCLDEAYPALLKEIHDPPMVLYVKGKIPADQFSKVAVVGSRKASFYGVRMAKSISAELAQAGVVVVSGLAEGIDSAAHEGALSGGGQTVAVLGGGLGKLYPPSNRKLFEKIAENGAVISEYPMDMAPLAPYFAVRNRIIAGLSEATVVVEAQEKSGALITTDVALSEGRDVFAVPGNADSLNSKGTNNLLKQGAKPVTGAADILEELQARDLFSKKKTASGSRAQKVPCIPRSAEEDQILSFLESESLHVDEIVDLCGRPVNQTISALSGMEVKGIVKQHPGKFFSKSV